MASPENGSTERSRRENSPSASPEIEPQLDGIADLLGALLGETQEQQVVQTNAASSRPAEPNATNHQPQPSLPASHDLPGPNRPLLEAARSQTESTTASNPNPSNQSEIVHLRQMNAQLMQKLDQLQAQVDASHQTLKGLLPAAELPKQESALVKSAQTEDASPKSEKAASVASEEAAIAAPRRQSNRSSPFLTLVLLSILSLVLLPLGLYQYRQHRLEQNAYHALSSHPDLAVYRLSVDMRGGTLLLLGNVPSERLRNRVEQVVRKELPDVRIDNDIIVTKTLPEEEQVAETVQQLAETLSQRNGTALFAEFDSGKVILEGTVLETTEVPEILENFEAIPGVDSVVNAMQVEPFPIASRLYFGTGSGEVLSVDMKGKLEQVRDFMQRYPGLHLKILGYSHPEEPGGGTALARDRAQTVQILLEDGGIDRRRMESTSMEGLPPGVTASQPTWLSRCVLFEVVKPVEKGY